MWYSLEYTDYYYCSPPLWFLPEYFNFDTRTKSKYKTTKRLLRDNVQPSLQHIKFIRWKVCSPPPHPPRGPYPTPNTFSVLPSTCDAMHYNLCTIWWPVGHNRGFDCCCTTTRAYYWSADDCNAVPHGRRGFMMTKTFWLFSVMPSNVYDVVMETLHTSHHVYCSSRIATHRCGLYDVPPSKVLTSLRPRRFSGGGGKKLWELYFFWSYRSTRYYVF